MGANSTQAAAITAFLAAFVLIAAGLAGEGIVFDLLGLVLLAVSAGLFMKCKPWEHAE
jgi:hypothetical protein